MVQAIIKPTTAFSGQLVAASIGNSEWVKLTSAYIVISTGATGSQREFAIDAVDASANIIFRLEKIPMNANLTFEFQYAIW